MVFRNSLLFSKGLPWRLSGKESTCQCETLIQSRAKERSPGEENGNPLQYSCLGKPMDTAAWQVHGVAKESDMI